MEPANGCRICMRILSGSGKIPWVWSTEGSLALQLAEPSGFTSTSYNRPAERKTGDSDWIDTHPGVRGSRLHIGLRRRRTIASIRPGPNLRKGAFYEGENCGGLQRKQLRKTLRNQPARNTRLSFTVPPMAFLSHVR